MKALDMIQRRDPYSTRARHRFKTLDADGRALVEAVFARHQRACRKTGIEPDPSFVAEAIDDAVNGRLEIDE